MQAKAITLAMGVVALALFTSACATSSPVGSSGPTDAPEKRPKLFRTQVGDQVTLQWDSEPGMVYGVVYSTNISDNRSWQFLPGYDRILGNGGSQTVTFTAPVSGKAYYRLREARRP